MLGTLISTNLPSSTLAVFLLWMLLGLQALHLSPSMAPESQERKVIIRCPEKQSYYLTSSPSPRSAGSKLTLFQNPGVGSTKEKPGVQAPRPRSLGPQGPTPLRLRKPGLQPLLLKFPRIQVSITSSPALPPCPPLPAAPQQT